MRRAERIADLMLTRLLLLPSSSERFFGSLKNGAGHWKQRQVARSSRRTVACCAFIVGAQARTTSASYALAVWAERDADSTEVEVALRAANEISRVRPSLAARAHPWVRFFDSSLTGPCDCALAATLQLWSRAARGSDRSATDQCDHDGRKALHELGHVA